MEHNMNISIYSMLNEIQSNSYEITEDQLKASHWLKVCSMSISSQQ